MANCVFVIPGLTQNPVLFQSVTVLDAGSKRLTKNEQIPAMGLGIFETQLAEPGDILLLFDEANLIFDFQQGRFYIRPDVNAP